jgi:hypothetical protein
LEIISLASGRDFSTSAIVESAVRAISCLLFS